MLLTEKELRQLRLRNIFMQIIEQVAFVIGAAALCAAAIGVFTALLWIHNYC